MSTPNQKILPRLTTLQAAVLAEACRYGGANYYALASIDAALRLAEHGLVVNRKIDSVRPAVRVRATLAGRLRCLGGQFVMSTDALMSSLLMHLREHRYAAGDEASFQRGIEIALDATLFAFEREVVLGPRARIDFLVDGSIGIEIKIDGATASVSRQLARYARHSRICGLILVTTRTKHLELDGIAIGEKPVRVLWQGGIG